MTLAPANPRTGESPEKDDEGTAPHSLDSARLVSPDVLSRRAPTSARRPSDREAVARPTSDADNPIVNRRRYQLELDRTRLRLLHALQTDPGATSELADLEAELARTPGGRGARLQRRFSLS